MIKDRNHNDLTEAMRLKKKKVVSDVRGDDKVKEDFQGNEITV